jgi:hypothetical protein
VSFLCPRTKPCFGGESGSAEDRLISQTIMAAAANGGHHRRACCSQRIRIAKSPGGHLQRWTAGKTIAEPARQPDIDYLSEPMTILVAAAHDRATRWRAAVLHRDAAPPRRASLTQEICGSPVSRSQTRLDTYPLSCPCGLRQRAMIAMAMSMPSRIVDADEHNSARCHDPG